MIGRVFFAAILAGIAAGFVMSAVQMWQVVPLIIQAEAYEQGDVHAGAHGAAEEHGHSHEHEAAGHSRDEGHGHAHEGWMPEDGIERTTYTILANLVTGVGFALVLMAAVVFSGRPITVANGAIWGLLGFLVFSLAPSAVLPPGLPGMLAADLVARQAWWLVTAAATAGGIAAILLFPGGLAKVAGLALIAAPHVIGGPEQPVAAGPLPAELAAAFVSASLAAAAVFWAVLGVVMGWLVEREPAAAEAPA